MEERPGPDVYAAITVAESVHGMDELAHNVLPLVVFVPGLAVFGPN